MVRNDRWARGTLPKIGTDATINQYRFFSSASQSGIRASGGVRPFEFTFRMDFFHGRESQGFPLEVRSSGYSIGRFDSLEIRRPRFHFPMGERTKGHILQRISAAPVMLEWPPSVRDSPFAGFGLRIAVRIPSPRGIPGETGSCNGNRANAP
jgi:hypothetical protein